MKFSKFFQYAYIAFAALFLYDAYSKWGDGTNSAYISLALAILAIFMYFFRRKFASKYNNTDSNKN